MELTYQCVQRGDAKVNKHQKKKKNRKELRLTNWGPDKDAKNVPSNCRGWEKGWEESHEIGKRMGKIMITREKPDEVSAG